MDQNELKRQVAEAALAYVVEGEIVGVGTGSTVNFFIDALAPFKAKIKGAVSSSIASTQRLQAMGIPVFDLNTVDRLPVYIDGADEINPAGMMIKGGGAALTREKIVAAAADRFVCIADASKQVDQLGKFPLPVEVIPMARALIMRQLSALGGTPKLRMKEGRVVLTDNGCEIIDVFGLTIADPVAMERKINALAGVVTVGIFARRKADVALLAGASGVQTLKF